MFTGTITNLTNNNNSFMVLPGNQYLFSFDRYNET
jgi:hypothetical protein